jgi:hypothetical protein
MLLAAAALAAASAASLRLVHSLFEAAVTFLP